MKRIWEALILCAMLFASAQAEPRQVFAYGGSGEDTLTDITAGADGRIVMTGSTDSTDGTLESRTLSGMAGWALCVDEQGEVLWSFCSRLSERENAMSHPVLHDDGSVTVILRSADQGWTEHEAIRLDREGTFLARRTLSRNEDVYIREEAIGAIAQGYLLKRENIRDWTTEIRLYDFDGNFVWQMGEWGKQGVHALSKAHVMRSGEGGIWLFGRDAQGKETPLCRVIAKAELGQKAYTDLMSLDDGGAAACGWMLEDGRKKGVIARWDVQGTLLSEMIIELGWLSQLVQTQDGFAASLCLGEVEPRDIGEWSLMRFDDLGVVKRWSPSDAGKAPARGCPLALLADGRIACLLNGEDTAAQEAKLMIFGAK